MPTHEHEVKKKRKRKAVNGCQNLSFFCCPYQMINKMFLSFSYELLYHGIYF